MTWHAHAPYISPQRDEPFSVQRKFWTLSRRLCVLSFRSFGGICETASCPVRDLSSPRVGNPRVSVSTSCPVTAHRHRHENRLDRHNNNKYIKTNNKNAMHENVCKLECAPMPNVMVALPNTGGALCSTPQSLADAHY